MDGPNLYRMVRNNPITYTDDNGKTSKNRNRNIFWFFSFANRKSGEGATRSLNRGLKIGRAIAGGIVLGGLIVTIAGVAGAGLAVITAVGAIGFGIGALLGYNTNNLLEKFGKFLAKFIQGKSVTTQAAAGAAMGATAAAAQGATPQGIAISTVAGAITGTIGAMIENSDSGMGGAIGAGSGVGVTDTMLGSSTSIRTELASATGGAVGGMISGTTGSTQVGTHAGYGAVAGSWLGFALDIATNPMGHITANAAGAVAGALAEQAVRTYGGRIIGHVLGPIACRRVGGVVGDAVRMTVQRPFFEGIFTYLGGLIGGIGTALHQQLDESNPVSQGLGWVGAQLDQIGGHIMDSVRENVLRTTGIANLKDFGGSLLNRWRPRFL